MYRSLCVLCAVVTAGLLSLPQNAQASPWTLPEDKFVLTLDSNYQTADEEYLPDGELQAFPLNGEFSAITFRLGGRYGVTDRFEIAANVDFKEINYEADPVVLALPSDPSDNQAVNDAIFDFGRNLAGVGDARIHGRYALVSGLVRATSQTSIKFPFGYERPRGTFAEDTAGPGAIEDDVSLGDGQTDLTQSFLFGAYIPATRSFARLDAGYRLRFGSPGDQGVANFSIGQYIGENFVIFAGANGAYTLFEGDSIGQSFITRSPEKPAGELQAGEGGDIETIELTLDKDYLNVEGGVIVQLRDLEIRASYGHIVWGSNIPQIQSVSLGVVYSLDNLTQEKAPIEKTADDS
jgi:hypothetical protein